MDISRLTASISEAADILDGNQDVSQEQRAQLYQACEKLSACLQPPKAHQDKLRFMLSEGAAIRTAIGMRIFDMFGDSTEATMTVSEIASRVPADPRLVDRIMRVLATVRIFDITPEGAYRATRHTKDFVKGSFAGDDYESNFELYCLMFCNLHKFLHKTNYQEPNDTNACPWQFTFNTNKQFFDWMQDHELVRDTFNRRMQQVMYDHWTAHFPVASRFEQFLASSKNPQPQMLKFVDIGCGSGHDIKGLLDKFPDLHGRFYLQDLPEGLQDHVFKGSQSPDSIQQIEAIPHSFFDAQPIKDGHVYFFGRIIHDWPDKDARKILAPIRDAMSDDSVLLIYDIVRPDVAVRPNALDSHLDLTMMVCFAALERSETRFRNLFESVGLELKNIWRCEGGKQSRSAVLEVVKRGECSGYRN